MRGSVVENEGFVMSVCGGALLAILRKGVLWNLTGEETNENTTHARTHTQYWRLSGGVLTLTKALFLALAKSKKHFSKSGKKKKKKNTPNFPCGVSELP